MINIITLSGYAGSGKNTVSKILHEKHGYVEMAFADKIRAALLKLNPVVTVEATASYGYPDIFRTMSLEPYLVIKTLQSIIDEHGWDKAKRKYPEIRRLMQVFGTEIGRELFGEDVWVRLLVEDLTKKTTEGQCNFVISDARFLNELNIHASMLEYGHVSITRTNINISNWWIERPGYGPLNAHASENSISSQHCSVNIDNNDTIKQLSTTIEIAVALSFAATQNKP